LHADALQGVHRAVRYHADVRHLDDGLALAEQVDGDAVLWIIAVVWQTIGAEEPRFEVQVHVVGTVLGRHVGVLDHAVAPRRRMDGIGGRPKSVGENAVAADVNVLAVRTREHVEVIARRAKGVRSAAFQDDRRTAVGDKFSVGGRPVRKRTESGYESGVAAGN